MREKSLEYDALSSVWEGSDGKLLEAMLRFYPAFDPEPILDTTYNTGRIWRGSSWEGQVVSMDIDPQYKPMIVADNREMKGVKSKQYGVVVFDPPHVGPRGATNVSSDSTSISGRRCSAGKNRDGR